VFRASRDEIRHSGLDPESSGALLDSGCRRNDGAKRLSGATFGPDFSEESIGGQAQR
jgi:hypothetical protein